MAAIPSDRSAFRISAEGLRRGLAPSTNTTTVCTRQEAHDLPGRHFPSGQTTLRRLFKELGSSATACKVATLELARTDTSAGFSAFTLTFPLTPASAAGSNRLFLELPTSEAEDAGPPLAAALLLLLDLGVFPPRPAPTLTLALQPLTLLLLLLQPPKPGVLAVAGVLAVTRAALGGKGQLTRVQ